MQKITRLSAAALAFSLLLAPAVQAQAEELTPDTPSEVTTEVPADDIPVNDSEIPVGDEGNNPEDAGSKQLRIATETFHAFGSPQSNDLKGFMPSLYQGKWFMPNKEERRQCIAKREGHHNYKTVSAGGLYRGTYQFSKALARGATWMMQKEVKKEMGQAGVDLVQELRKTPMNQWNRYWQDRAFWTIWRKGAGSSHWSGGHRSC